MSMDSLFEYNRLKNPRLSVLFMDTDSSALRDPSLAVQEIIIPYSPGYAVIFLSLVGETSVNAWHC